ncbi:unnamed protein product [Caenorhabditis brenneri]
MAPAIVGRWLENRHIVPPVASYWVVSIGLVFLNQHLLSGTGEKLNVPLFITWCQCLVTVVLCTLLHWGSEKWSILPIFPKLDLNLRTCKDILPLSVVFVAMISFNNLCLKNTGVSFYYIGRSLATVFNVFLTPHMLGEMPSKNIHLACFLIIIGFSIGSGEKDIGNELSVNGVFFGIAASFVVALNAILTKTALPKVGNCIWKLTWYNNVLASILFIPFMMLTGDLERIYNEVPDGNFWRMLLVSGIFGFSMNYVTGWQIKATSPLTHNISANAKSATQTLLAVIVFREIKPFSWWTSNFVILLGSSFYTWTRNHEMKKEEEANKSKTS